MTQPVLETTLDSDSKPDSDPKPSSDSKPESESDSEPESDSGLVSLSSETGRSAEASSRLDVSTDRVFVRVLVGAATALATIAVVAAHRQDPLLAVQLSAAVLCLGILSAVDLAEQRLPNRITLPLAAVTTFFVIIDGSGRLSIWAAVAPIGVGLAFAFLFVVLRFGMGDAKLALTVGMISGWLGTDAIIATAYTAAASGALTALILLIVHRRRDVSFPFGPILAVGSVVGMVVGAAAL